LTHDTPPPVPTPPPAPPAPSPKTCKGQMENPTCQPFNLKGCKAGGCQKCADETTYSCAACCPGCEMHMKGGVKYCDDPSIAV
jgi:hypothetical protein